MKKIMLSFSVVLIFVSLNAFGSNVNLTDAEQVAKNVYFERSGIDQSDIRFEDIISYEYNNNVVFYIFDVENDKGFIIISADDAYYPVIAYSTDSPFSFTDMPEHVAGLYNDFAVLVDYVKNNNIKATDAIVSEWKKYNVNQSDFTFQKNSKGVLLTTANWDQGGGFDDWVPFNEDGVPPVGCVATAMGIIMKYWNYPLQGNGANSYYEYPYGTLSANFGNSHYFWNQMDDNNVGNTYEAHVSFHLGVSVNMNYGLDGSGAYVNGQYGNGGHPSSVYAFKYFFKYKTSMHFEYKSNYSDEAWKNLLKTDLDLDKLIMYRGSSNDGGHAWVCDGYNDSDLFHYNFGWGGFNNGYYNINNVNGFTLNNGAIFGLEPNIMETYEPAPENLLAEIDGSVLDDFIVELSWDAPSNKTVDEYVIYRIDYDADGFNHTFEEIATVNSSTTSYIDNEAEVGNKDYLIQAIHTEGEGYAATDYLRGLFNINFRVHDTDGNLIQNGFNGQVIFNGETIATGFGSASFSDVPYGGDQLWVASADGHPETSGLVDVVGVETFNVYLDGTIIDVNNLKNKSVSIYPNPVSDILYINMPDTQKEIFVTIYDITGKNIDRKRISSDESMINISDLTKGFYFIEFTIDQERIIKKIIVD